jgi:hypothetical protein
MKSSKHILMFATLYSPSFSRGLSTQHPRTFILLPVQSVRLLYVYVSSRHRYVAWMSSTSRLRPDFQTQLHMDHCFQTKAPSCRVKAE